MDICRDIIDCPGVRDAVTRRLPAEILAGEKNHVGKMAELLESVPA